MDWPERLNAAIDYLEANLAGELDVTEAARRAACSPFYFQRLFAIVTGMTVGEYIRKRRLTLAASDLSSGRVKVIDVALRYGYDSPDAFRRAFRAMHGVTPQAARGPGVTLAACPRISFHVELKGGNDMDYKLIERPAFKVAITSRQFATENGQNFKDIPVWWREFIGSPEHKTMTGLTGNRPGARTGGVMLGVCYGNAGDGSFSYGIAVELPEGAAAGPFDTMEIPATAWAVFDCTLRNLQDVTARVFRDWYAATGYDYPGTPDLEVYLDEGEGDDMKCQIWAPVVKK
jgi:AraC family transcriptional regulator